jgi:hypothetical protein
MGLNPPQPSLAAGIRHRRLDPGINIHSCSYQSADFPTGAAFQQQSLLFNNSQS